MGGERPPPAPAGPRHQPLPPDSHPGAGEHKKRPHKEGTRRGAGRPFRAGRSLEGRPRGFVRSRGGLIEFGSPQTGTQMAADGRRELEGMFRALCCSWAPRKGGEGEGRGVASPPRRCHRCHRWGSTCSGCFISSQLALLGIRAAPNPARVVGWGAPSGAPNPVSSPWSSCPVHRG